MLKRINQVVVVQRNPEVMVGKVLTVLFALLGIFDLVSGGVLWR